MTNICLIFLPVILNGKLNFNQKLPFSCDNTFPDFQHFPFLAESVASLWQLLCPGEQRIQHLLSHL